MDLELKKFFDRVNHPRLMFRIAQRVTDKAVLELIGRMQKAQTVMPDGMKVSTSEANVRDMVVPLTAC